MPSNRAEWMEKNKQRECSIEGCGRKRTGVQGVCGKHKYERDKGKPKPPCTVEGCPNPRHWNGLCQAHKARLDRTGDVMADVPINPTFRGSAAMVCARCGTDDMPPVKERSGTGSLCIPCANERHKEWRAAQHCKVEGCPNGYYSSGLCNPHWNRLTKLGDVMAEFDQTGENSPKWVGDQAKYVTAIVRVSTERGKPAMCEWCGNDDPDRAYAWMLDPDVDESHVKWGYNSGSKLRYSLDVMDYVRLCASCKQTWVLGNRRYGERKKAAS